MAFTASLIHGEVPKPDCTIVRFHHHVCASAHALTPLRWCTSALDGPSLEKRIRERYAIVNQNYRRLFPTWLMARRSLVPPAGQACSGRRVRRACNS